MIEKATQTTDHSGSQVDTEVDSEFTRLTSLYNGNHGWGKGVQLLISCPQLAGEGGFSRATPPR